MPRRGGVPENLRPYKKGQSGNPTGGAKIPWRRWLSNAVDEDARACLLAVMRKGSVKPETRARVAQYFLDQLHGRAKETVQHEGERSVVVVNEKIGARLKEANVLVIDGNREIPPA